MNWLSAVSRGLLGGSTDTERAALAASSGLLSILPAPAAAIIGAAVTITVATCRYSVSVGRGIFSKAVAATRYALRAITNSGEFK